MNLPLRHSHIAVRKPLGSLARSVGADISTGEDDLGEFRYFDLIVSHEDGGNQRIRFASHAGDRMVHLLAEKIDAASDLAAALFAAGMDSKAALSISTDHAGAPLRNAAEITGRMAAMSKTLSPETGGMDLVLSPENQDTAVAHVTAHRAQQS